MNYRVLFFIIAMAALLMGSVLFFVVSSGAKYASNEVLAQQQGIGLDSPSVTKGAFTLGTPTFDNTSFTCNAPYTDVAYVSLILQYHAIPQSCTAFVDGRFQTDVQNLTPDCIGSCPYTDFARTIPLGPTDTRENHTVKMCCDGICVKKTLEGICPTDNPLSK